MPTPPSPQWTNSDILDVRMRHLREELDEIRSALAAGDLVGTLDGIIDLQYVAEGLAVNLGLPIVEGFELVHQANMAKVAPKSHRESRRGTMWDAIKPPGWQSPNLRGLFPKEAL